MQNSLGDNTTTATLDIAHLAFLESIRENTIRTGAAATKGSLMRRAENIAAQLPETEYKSLEEWEAAVKTMTHPLARIEGTSIRDGNLFVLPACPFAPSIRTYKEIFKQLPGEYAQIVEEFNKAGKHTGDLKVGHGSGVSPFCAVHQSLRSAAGAKIKVGNKKIQIVQLGCKSGDGKMAIADELCAFAGIERKAVEKHLEKAACIYAVMIQDK